MMPRKFVAVLCACLSLSLITPAAHAQEKSKDKTPATVAVFVLKGEVVETPQQEELFFGAGERESLKDLIARMEKARDDDAVKAIVLLLDESGLGWGQIEEIRRVIDEIRAKKKVYAHAESLTTVQFVLLSAASHLSVVPTGDLFITGIYGEQPYLRGLLDMLGVKPDYLTCGAYKSAAEMFMRKGPSDEAKEMYGWLYDSLYENSVKQIADGRGVKPEKVKQWIDHGLYSAEQAKKDGIIDAAQHREELEAALKKEYGESVKFDRSYGKKKGKTIDFSSPFGILNFYADLLSPPKSTKSKKDAVAVVYVEGPIMLGSPEANLFGSTNAAYSSPIRKALDEAAEDDTVKAVVLRIDSPGGSAVASEVILNATQRVAGKKPFIVSMGNVAGSGGYYVACGTKTIFADPSTITGSIGVVAGKFATTKMWDKIGVHWNPIQRGEHAGILSSADVFSDEERKLLQNWMDEIYGVFKKHVVEARGDRLKKDIDDIAGGRVYTGRQALELGLIDEIGGLDAAIEHIAKQADLEDYEIRVLPRPKNILEQLLGDAAAKEDDHKTLSLPASAVPRTHSLLDAALPYLQGLDPHRVRTVKAALDQLMQLQHERVLLTMPVLEFRD